MSEKIANVTIVNHKGELARPDSDAALVRAAKEDCLAFDALYCRYYDRVYSYLRLHTVSGEDPADLTHQVFLKALDSLSKYRDRGAPFSAWLIRIARNAAIDASRKRRRMVSPDLVPEAVLELDSADPETAVLQAERLERLRSVLGGLSKEKLDLLALRFTAGLSSREIALVVGKSESAVKKMMTRTLSALKEELDETSS